MATVDFDCCMINGGGLKEGADLYAKIVEAGDKRFIVVDAKALKWKAFLSGGTKTVDYITAVRNHVGEGLAAEEPKAF